MDRIVATNESHIARALRPVLLHSVVSYGRAEPAMINAEAGPVVLMTTVCREHIAGEEHGMQPPFAWARGHCRRRCPGGVWSSVYRAWRTDEGCRASHAMAGLRPRCR